jgi:hypothetical protein
VVIVLDFLSLPPNAGDITVVLDKMSRRRLLSDLTMLSQGNGLDNCQHIDSKEKIDDRLHLREALWYYVERVNHRFGETHAYTDIKNGVATR